MNHTSYPDLYFALRGGGNNFGIVTRFDLETFPQGPMWGGARTYPITAAASLISAFDNFAANGPSDPDAALILAFYYYNGTYHGSTDMEYAHAVVDPAIFRELTGVASLASTTRIANLTNLTLEFEASNPGGFRETYFTATFKPSAVLEREILDIYVSEVEGIKDAEGLLPAVVFQPITKDIISYFSKNGGNALGIAESDGPLNCELILILLAVAHMWQWSISPFRGLPHPTTTALWPRPAASLTDQLQLQKGWVWITSSSTRITPHRVKMSSVGMERRISSA